MGYKILGFVVWRGAKWYLRRSYGHLVPSRRLLAGGFVALAIGALLLAGRRQGA